MQKRTLTIGLAVGVLAIAGLGGWSLATASPGTTAGTRARAGRPVPGARVPSSRIRPAVPDRDLLAPRAGEAVPADPRAALAGRAADLFERYRAVAQPGTPLPDGVREALLAFLREGDEARAAFLRLLWDRESPSWMRAEMTLLFRALPGAEDRGCFLAALAAADPEAAEKKAAAAIASDADRLVSFLRSPAGDIAERIRVLKTISPATAGHPAVTEEILALADRDADEQVRTWSYWQLGRLKTRAAKEILARAASDETRSEVERRAAARQLAEIPGVETETFLRLFAQGPESVRLWMLQPLANSPADPRVDALLLDALGDATASVNYRVKAADAIGLRILNRPDAQADGLADRAAEVIRGMDARLAAKVLNMLESVVAQSRALRELVMDLQRDSGEGSPVRTAIAASPVLRRVVETAGSL